MKRLIQQQLDIAPARQRLVYAGNVLEDDRVLSSYGIHAGARLRLVVRPATKLRIIVSAESWSGRYRMWVLPPIGAAPRYGRPARSPWLSTSTRLTLSLTSCDKSCVAWAIYGVRISCLPGGSLTIGALWLFMISPTSRRFVCVATSAC